MNSIEICQYFIFWIICEIGYVRLQSNTDFMNLKKAFWSTNLNQNAYLKMVRESSDPESPYQKFTIETDDLEFVTFDKDHVELLYLYNTEVQFVLKLNRDDDDDSDAPIAYGKTVFNFELQDTDQRDTFYKLFAPINQYPLPLSGGNRLTYVQRIWEDETGPKWFLAGEDAVINFRLIGFEESMLYIIKSRKSHDGVGIPFLIFRSKKFAIAAVKDNKVVVEVVHGEKYASLLFILAFSDKTEAFSFVNSVNHDSMECHVRINVLEKFKSIL